MSYLTSFTVNKQGAVNVKQLVKAIGIIQYYFKGKKMSVNDARIISVLDDKHIVVENDTNKERNTFVLSNGNWLMEAHCSIKSLMYGTRFTTNEIK